MLLGITFSSCPFSCLSLPFFGPFYLFSYPSYVFIYVLSCGAFSLFWTFSCHSFYAPSCDTFYHCTFLFLTFFQFHLQVFLQIFLNFQLRDEILFQAQSLYQNLPCSSSIGTDRVHRSYQRSQRASRQDRRAC